MMSRPRTRNSTVLTPNRQLRISAANVSRNAHKNKCKQPRLCLTLSKVNGVRIGGNKTEN